MTNGNKITKKEHYIPQCILKRFTLDGKRICRYDIKNNTQQNYISIGDVCFEKYLYETKSKGQIVNPNKIEHAFSKIETILDHKIEKIEKYLYNKTIYKKDFLSKEDIKFWVKYITAHILRHPNSIKLGKNYFQTYGISEEEANNMAIRQNNVFFDFASPQERVLLEAYMSIFNNFALQILVDETNSIFINEKIGSFLKNGGKGFYFMEVHPDTYMSPWTKIIFPIAKNIVLMFYNLNEINDPYIKNNNNIIRKMTSKEMSDIKKNIIIDAKNMIMSSQPLTKGQIRNYFNKK